MSEQIYQQAAAQQAQTNGSAGGAGEEPVEDADYEVIDEDARDRA